MSKFKRIIEFILALLNFLFHFKPSTDDKTAIVTKTIPALLRRLARKGLNLYLKLSLRIRLRLP